MFFFYKYNINIVPLYIFFNLKLSSLFTQQRFKHKNYFFKYKKKVMRFFYKRRSYLGLYYDNCIRITYKFYAICKRKFKKHKRLIRYFNHIPFSYKLFKSQIIISSLLNLMQNVNKLNFFNLKVLRVNRYEYRLSLGQANKYFKRRLYRPFLDKNFFTISKDFYLTFLKKFNFFNLNFLSFVINLYKGSNQTFLNN